MDQDNEKGGDGKGKKLKLYEAPQMSIAKRAKIEARINSREKRRK